MTPYIIALGALALLLAWSARKERIDYDMARGVISLNKIAWAVDLYAHGFCPRAIESETGLNINTVLQIQDLLEAHKKGGLSALYKAAPYLNKLPDYVADVLGYSFPVRQKEKERQKKLGWKERIFITDETIEKLSPKDEKVTL